VPPRSLWPLSSIGSCVYHRSGDITPTCGSLPLTPLSRLLFQLCDRARQSEAYMAAAMARGCQVRFVPMPGTSHYDIVFGLAEPESPHAQMVIETMGLT
jgi:hypothetical protein